MASDSRITEHGVATLPETKVGDLGHELGVARQTLYRHISPSGELRPDEMKLPGQAGK